MLKSDPKVTQMRNSVVLLTILLSVFPRQSKADDIISLTCTFGNAKNKPMHIDIAHEFITFNSERRRGTQKILIADKYIGWEIDPNAEGVDSAWWQTWSIDRTTAVLTLRTNYNGGGSKTEKAVCVKSQNSSPKF
jgi:hypothetical protein